MTARSEFANFGRTVIFLELACANKTVDGHKDTDRWVAKGCCYCEEKREDIEQRK